MKALAAAWRPEVDLAVDWLRQRGFAGRVGLVLGSGLGSFAEAVKVEAAADFADIPGFAPPSVGMHRGRLVLGRAADVPVLIMQGRLHPYEGLPYRRLLLPVAVLAGLGVDPVVLTNAAGGLNRFYRPGDFMVMGDHLDLHLDDPLRGLTAASAPGRDAAVSHLYDRRLIRLLTATAARQGMPLHTGTYASMPGPAFETRAEIGMLRRLGCDAVGMSTTAEAVLLRRLGVRPVGLSCITNPARETHQPVLSHHDVLEVGGRVQEALADLLLACLPGLAAV